MTVKMCSVNTPVLDPLDEIYSAASSRGEVNADTDLRINSPSANNVDVKLTVIIMTFNESCHIARAIESLRCITSTIVLVDSGSTDGTQEIAKSLGALVLHNPWTSHAGQFNWALENLPWRSEWILRLDADEIISSDLGVEIARRLPGISASVRGVYINRWMAFMGRRIRYGGVFPIRVLRLFRHGHGHCENRWMDEHIIVDGAVVDFSGGILDDNIKSLDWWTDKHNSYASREVIDMLNLQYGFMPMESVASLGGRGGAGIKRWIKENIYMRLPSGFRPFLYFFYRYILRLGFLDGFEGCAFHFLQGFWYRFLVDAKLYEVRKYMRVHCVEPREAIMQVLGVNLDSAKE